MNNVTATLLGVFLCIGWPAIWVAIAVYVMRYKSPIEFRGFFQPREDSE